MFWHQFDLPKCQVHGGNAAEDLNGHFGGLFGYFLHFAPKTSERTIGDLYDLAFAHLMMFSHTTICFSYGLRLPGIGKLDIRSFRQGSGTATAMPYRCLRWSVSVSSLLSACKNLPSKR